MKDEDMRQFYHLAERFVEAFESIAISIVKIANPIHKYTPPKPSPQDRVICTCTLDPKSKLTCPMHGVLEDPAEDPADKIKKVKKMEEN